MRNQTSKLKSHWEHNIPIQGPIVAYGRHQDHLIGRELPHLVYKRVVHEIWAADTQVQHVDLLHNGVVERIQEPRGVRYLAMFK